MAQGLTAPPSGGEIAGYAKRYAGVPYKWAGYLPSGWDCSGFVNYVLGHHFGMVLPGKYRWTGRGHGPTAAMYKVWSKASTVSTAEPGDLCVWATHIGIALGPKSMISAVDTQMGTAITSISGPAGEPLSVRRINTLAATSSTGPGTTAVAAGGCAPAALMLPYLYLKGLFAGDWLPED